MQWKKIDKFIFVGTSETELAQNFITYDRVRFPRLKENTNTQAKPRLTHPIIISLVFSVPFNSMHDG